MPWGRKKGNGAPFGMEIDTLANNDKMLIETARSIDEYLIKDYI